MASHFEVLPRQLSVLVYGEHPTDFIASAQITVMGDRGMMHSITGRGWFAHWARPGAVDQLLASCGVKSFEGYATLAHARLMARSLRHVAKVSFGLRGEMAGRPMVWCVVEPKEIALEVPFLEISKLHVLARA